jgi:hypothetical protein
MKFMHLKSFHHTLLFMFRMIFSSKNIMYRENVRSKIDANTKESNGITKIIAKINQK